jgi:hypothetical protein
LGAEGSVFRCRARRRQLRRFDACPFDMTSFPFARDVICPFGLMASCPLGRMSGLCCASLRHTVLPCTRRQQLATLCYITAGLCNVATAVQSGATDRLAKRYKAKSAIFVWVDGTPAETLTPPSLVGSADRPSPNGQSGRPSPPAVPEQGAASA